MDNNSSSRPSRNESAEWHTRIRHHDVQPPKLLHPLFKQSLHLLRLRHVRLHRHRLPALAFDLFDHFFGGGGPFDVVDDDGGAVGGEGQGVLSAHAAAAAGDEGDFVGEGLGDGGGHGGEGWGGGGWGG